MTFVGGMAQGHNHRPNAIEWTAVSDRSLLLTIIGAVFVGVIIFLVMGTAAAPPASPEPFARMQRTILGMLKDDPQRSAKLFNLIPSHDPPGAMCGHFEGTRFIYFPNTTGAVVVVPPTSYGRQSWQEMCLG
jgi:hypothetical protein